MLLRLFRTETVVPLGWLSLTVLLLFVVTLEPLVMLPVFVRTEVLPLCTLLSPVFACLETAGWMMGWHCGRWLTGCR